MRFIDNVLEINNKFFKKHFYDYIFNREFIFSKRINGVLTAIRVYTLRALKELIMIISVLGIEHQILNYSTPLTHHSTFPA